MKNSTKWRVGATLYKPNFLGFTLLLVWAVMPMGMVGCSQGQSAGGEEVAADPSDRTAEEPASIDLAFLEGVSAGRAEIVQMMLDRGANVNAANSKGVTALMIAGFKGHSEVVKLLLNQPNLNLSARDRDGWSPLFYALKSEKIEILQLMLRQPGLDVNAKDVLGLSALNWALILGEIEIVTLMSKQPGIDINVRDALGRTPLMWAATLCRPKMADLLLNMKTEPQMVDVNAVDVSGRSALMWAAFNGCSPIVERLLEQPGVGLEDEDHQGKTALRLAEERGQTKVFEILNSRRLL